MNAMVEGDGTYYEADAGYSGTAPRYYSITQRSSLFSYYTVSGGIELYQYDGYDGMTDVLEIPEEINGRTVVGIGDSFLTMDDSITEVILPDTLTYLGQSAFNSCSALTTLHIPAGVTSIGAFAFTNDNALVNFTCDPANPSYTVEGGVLYDKAKTTVLGCAGGGPGDAAGNGNRSGRLRLLLEPESHAVVSAGFRDPDRGRGFWGMQ